MQYLSILYYKNQPTPKRARSFVVSINLYIHIIFHYNNTRSIDWWVYDGCLSDNKHKGWVMRRDLLFCGSDFWFYDSPKNYYIDEFSIFLVHRDFIKRDFNFPDCIMLMAWMTTILTIFIYFMFNNCEYNNNPLYRLSIFVPKIQWWFVGLFEWILNL